MKNYSLENHEFVQEVDENDLNGNSSYKDKAKKFVILLIILVIISLITIIIGFSLHINGYGKKEETKKAGLEDLFIVHSKPEFGETIKSFSDYTSSLNAHNYTFYVQNNTKNNIYYYIYFYDVDFGVASNLCDKTKLNYELIKNGKSVSSGLMKNEKMVKLIKTNIFSNSKDDYTLKLWSENNCNGYIKYKVNVSE